MTAQILTTTLSRRLLLQAAGATLAVGTGQSAFAQSADASQAATARRVLFVNLPLKPEAFDDFIEVMRENVRQSRAEAGNISFDVYQREGGGDDLFLFERWTDQAALDTHMQTSHLKAVEARIATDLRAPASQLSLVELSPTVTPPQPADPASTRNVLVTLHVLPEARDEFVAALLGTVEPSRAAPGNLGWELLQDADDPTTLFLMERWESIAAHEAHLAQPYNEPVNRIFEASLAQPPGDGHRLAADVSAPA